MYRVRLFSEVNVYLRCVTTQNLYMDAFSYLEIRITDRQAYKLKFKVRELISCFCCIHTSHTALEADSQGSGGI